MVADPKAIFTWDNFDDVIPYIMGTPDIECGEHRSVLGRYIEVNSDTDVCTGRVEYFDFAPDFKAVLIDNTWFRDHTFNIKDGDWIRFNFSLSIEVEMQLSNDKSVKVLKPSWRILNNPAELVVIEKIPKNKRSAWVTICCKKEIIETYSGDAYENLPDLLQESLSIEDGDSFHNYHDFTARLNSITADMLKTELTGSLRLAYIKARCVELICHALNHLIHSPISPPSIKLSDSDHLALESAHSILLESYRNAPSISDLSRQLGINRNKLFYGFKMKHGCSVSEFVQNQRLEEGKHLLQQTERSISDIAAAVGFSHQSNFSTAMKNHFGLTPKQFRN